MLQHRWEERWAANGLITIKLLLPRRLAAIAKLIDISAGGMALTAPVSLSPNSLIKVQYELPGGYACNAPALVTHCSDRRLGLMVCLTNPRAKRQHARLLDSCRNRFQRRPPGKKAANTGVARRPKHEKMTGSGNPNR